MQETLAQLRKLNFEELIHIDTDDAASYTYESYAANKGHKIKDDGIGGCNKCETSGLASSSEIDLKPKLSLISHGTHSQDYFSLLKPYSKSSIDWRDDPVMFVLESPSIDSRQYNISNTEMTWKKPSKSWYWLPNENESKLDDYNPLEYGKNSNQGKYGEYFASIIYRFGLRNAYITNMLKCGISVADKPIFDSRRCKCIRDNCISQYLDQEVRIFQPKAIFTFGHNAYNRVRKGFNNYIPSESLFYLPHPASWLNKKSYQEISHKHLLFGLTKTGIINPDEERKLVADFINRQ